MGTFSQRLCAAALSAVVLVSAGCAGTPQRRPGPGITGGGTRTGPGMTGGAPRGTTPGPTGGTTGGTVGSSLAGITGAGAGAGVGAGLTNTAAPLDLGQQISTYVAGIEGVGRSGAAGAPSSEPRVSAQPSARSVGVSTIVLGNVAFVGLDLRTLPGGGTTSGAWSGGTTTGTKVGTTAGTSGDWDALIRSRVIERFPQIADVFVTTDPGTVHRIARVGAHIRAGASAAPHLGEMHAIASLMTRGTTGRSGAPTGTAIPGPGLPGTTGAAGGRTPLGTTGVGGMTR